eukprot:CAMPEP_0170584610 /NCGR_PEP_ID=MMETSP0224-20130122/8775_1 /TAXON_ID=285029 /ORGANISM="Togula jolla, Strain CCCM 725" /LENGTH=533 /DNA_ID=CAMNT_0010908045 /DNA_START=130 /DNA_END=1731 /DNA_ORIENTATION=-
MTKNSDRSEEGILNFGENLLEDSAVWSSFSFLVGFLIVFRTSQCYSRFLEACNCTHSMRAEWFDACSSAVAFARHATGVDDRVKHFENTIVRLFSMLHCAALVSIVDDLDQDIDTLQAFRYPLIDAAGFDKESLLYLRGTSNRGELIFQWIQELVTDSIHTGVMNIPAPILSRFYHELASGLVHFHMAVKIADIPFPFPYAQTCDLLLILHGVLVPIVTREWVKTPLWAFVFSFVQVFIMWSLNFIAIELEDPFGSDANDIDLHAMQVEMNEYLLLLLRPNTRMVPQLTPVAQDLHFETKIHFTSFRDIWDGVERLSQEDDIPTPRTEGRTDAKQRLRKATETSRDPAASMPLPLAVALDPGSYPPSPWWSSADQGRNSSTEDLELASPRTGGSPGLATRESQQSPLSPEPPLLPRPPPLKRDSRVGRPMGHGGSNLQLRMAIPKATPKACLHSQARRQTGSHCRARRQSGSQAKEADRDWSLIRQALKICTRRGIPSAPRDHQDPLSLERIGQALRLYRLIPAGHPATNTNT